MNKNIRIILVGLIFAVAYWGYSIILGAVANRVDFLYDFVFLLGGPNVFIPVTFAIIAVIVLFKLKPFEKVSEALICALASVVFNFILFELAALLDGFGAMYMFYTAIFSTAATVVAYIILLFVKNSNKKEHKKTT